MRLINGDGFLRTDHSLRGGDQVIGLGFSVQPKVEDGGLGGRTLVEITACGDQFILLRDAQGNDLSGRSNDL